MVNIFINKCFFLNILSLTYINISTCTPAIIISITKSGKLQKQRHVTDANRRLARLADGQVALSSRHAQAESALNWQYMTPDPFPN
jgi:hypothetical protein